MDLHALLADLAMVFLAGVLAVLALGRLGLPPVVGFLAAGLLIGPQALALVDDPHTIEVVSELGVALLLFTIGLEFSFDRLKRIGRLVAVGGTLQVGLTVAAAVVGALVLGAAPAEGVFWGYLAAVSSTAIVLRLLGDRGEMDAPHGRFIVGVLIFQDLAIVPMMLTVPLLSGEDASAWGLARVLGEAALVFGGVVVAARLVVPRLLDRAARARGREVFVLSVLLVASAVAWATSAMGMSIAMGAFLAGIVVAETEFVHQVSSEVAPFRDALASMFFVSVGMLLDPSVILDRPVAVAGLVALLVVGKLVLAAVAVLLMRFPARVALLAGIGLAQVGEFSFVLLRSGESAGIVSAEAGSVFLAASVLTMVAAPLLVSWSPRLAAGAVLLRPLERLLAVRPAEESVRGEAPLRDHVVVAGFGLGGRTLVHSLEAAQVPYVVLELNPETVVTERKAGHHIRYGDATSAEVLEHVAHVAQARQVVLLLSDLDAARRAASLIRARWPSVPLLLRVHRLEREGADVALPGVQVLAEDHETAVEIVERVLRTTGASGAVVAAAVAAARQARGDSGEPIVSPTALGVAFRTLAVPMGTDDAGVGQTLGDLDLRARTGALVVAIARAEGIVTSPGAGEALRQGDTVFLVGDADQVAIAARCLAVGLELAAAEPVAG